MEIYVPYEMIDLGNLRLCLEAIRTHVSPQPSQLKVVGPTLPEKLAGEIAKLGATWVDDATIIPGLTRDRMPEIPHEGGDLGPRYFERFMSWGMAFHAQSDHYAVVDPALIFINPVTLIVGDAMVFYKEGGVDPRRLAMARKLLGQFDPPAALVPHFMVFDRRIVRQMLMHIAQRHPGKRFEEAVFDSIDLEHPDGFSAFDTYGWFAALAAPQKIQWRSTGTMTFHKDIAGVHGNCAALARRRQCDAVYYQPARLHEVDEFIAEARKFIDPADVKVMLDVGSRDAEVSLAAKRHLPNARLWAFECNPDAIRLCRANLRGRDDITLVERAVSNVSGPVDFFAINPVRTKTPLADGNIGASSLFQAGTDYPYEQYEQDKITVQAVTLGEWAKDAGIEEIDLMWVDLQGAELHAFQGLGEMLAKVKIIYTEVEYRQMYRGQPLHQELSDFLTSHGFRLHKKFNTGEWFGNELFVREDLNERPQPAAVPSKVQVVGTTSGGSPIISFSKPVGST